MIPKYICLNKNLFIILNNGWVAILLIPRRIEKLGRVNQNGFYRYKLSTLAALKFTEEVSSLKRRNNLQIEVLLQNEVKKFQSKLIYDNFKTLDFRNNFKLVVLPSNR